MASQNLARLGIVMGIDTAELETGINEAIRKFGKLKQSIKRESDAAAKEIIALEYATKDYGKTLTKVEQIQREITSGKYANATKQLKDMLLDQARAYDAVAESAKKANMAQMGGAGGKLPPHLQAALGYQTTDIVTSLLGGQNPMMVLIQQGGQLRDQFGGFVPLFKAISSVLNPMRIAIGGTAVAMAGLAFAAYKGQEESSKFRDSLILTNNIAGITASQFQMMSAALSDKLNVSIGKTNDVFMELVASGKFTSVSLASVGNAIGLISKLSGETAATVTKDLIASLDGTANSAAKLNEKYNFLNLAQYKQIELLAQQNKKQEAIKLTADLLSESLEKQERNVGTLEKAWESLGKIFGSFWNTLKGIGKDETTQDIVNRLKKEIEYLETAMTGLSGERNKAALEAKKKQLQEYLEIQNKEIVEAQKKATAQANENAKINAYQEAGGLQKAEDLKSEYAKLKADQLFQVKVFGVNEITRIEMESEKKKADFAVDQQRKSEQEKFVFATDRAKIVSQFIINEDLRVAQTKEEIFRKEQLRITERQQADLDSLAREREKLQVYRENILASDNDKQIALDRLRTEQEIAKIMINQKLSPEQKVADVERERTIQSQREGVIRLGEQLVLVQSIHTAVFNNMTSAIESFVRTGKFAFKDFTRSVIQDIIAIQLKAQATKILSMAGASLGGMTVPSGMGGGGGISFGDLFAPGGGTGFGATASGLYMANGGDVSGNTPYIVGEVGPELFVPKGAGTIIPNKDLGGMGGQTINYNGTYIANMSAIDTQSATQFLVQNKQTIWAANQSASRSMPTSR
jgi:phage-related minor tail protein